MKSTLFIIGLAVLICGKEQQLKLVSAYSTHWAGGIAGRSGTNFEIVLKGNGKLKPEFKSIWIEGEGRFEIPKGTDGDVYVIENDAAQTYNLTVKTFHSYSTVPGDIKTEEKILTNPFSVKGKAVLHYTQGKKNFYLSIPDFERKPNINYP